MSSVFIAVTCHDLYLLVTGCHLKPYTIQTLQDSSLFATVDGLVLVVVQWEKLRLEAEAAALKECTFVPKPVANNRRHLAGYVPIQDRLGELQRRKRCACELQFECA